MANVENFLKFYIPIFITEFLLTKSTCSNIIRFKIIASKHFRTKKENKL